MYKLGWSKDETPEDFDEKATTLQIDSVLSVSGQDYDFFSAFVFVFSPHFCFVSRRSDWWFAQQIAERSC